MRAKKKLFLYCSLYPEDNEIWITELVEYCWLEGYIHGDGSTEVARKKGYSMVMNLVDASLLERGRWNIAYVKMHDVVRDFALREAREFLVKAGMNIKHPLKEKEWLQMEKISLMKSNLCNLLLERPNCSTLSTLLLQDNETLTMIPDSFFEFMHSLCILDLSRTRIKSLPSSLCNLVNLRGLYLKTCESLEELPSQVGAFTQLKVLDLGGLTQIKYLPREVGKLTRLKRLIVSFRRRRYHDDDEACSQDDDKEDPCSKDDDDDDACSQDEDGDGDACSQDEDGDGDGDDEDACSQDDDDEDTEESVRVEFPTEEWNMKLRVPTGIFPKLRDLEELSLYAGENCSEKGQWDDESMEVVVEELCSLEHLTYLDIYFPTVKCLEYFLAHSKSVKATSSWFRRFRFRVGTEIRDLEYYGLIRSRERVLVYRGGVGMSHAAIMETLAHSSFFVLHHHLTARKLSELGLANMNELKKCWINGCEKMETLFDGDEQHETCAVLPNLEALKLGYLPELRSLCDGPLLPGSLSKLTSLDLYDCKNLKKVFQLGILRQLCSLQFLFVRFCLKTEEIIENEKEEEMSVASHSHNDRVILPNIKDFKLFGLPELVSICRGFSNFEWPSLHTIEILDCPKLKSLSFLSNGTNIVPPALREIKGWSSWWEEELEWEDNDIKQRLQPFFNSW